MHSNASMIFIKDRDHKLVFGNQRFRSEFGGNAGPTSLLGKTGQEYLPSTLKMLSKSSDEEVAEYHRIWTKSFTLRSKTLQATKIPIVSKDGRYTGLIGFTIDANRPALADRIRYSNREYAQLSDALRCLDQKEIELIKLVGQGVLNKQLAGHFDVSIRTVENWRQKLMQSLKIKNAAQLIRFVVDCERYGLL